MGVCRYHTGVVFQGPGQSLVKVVGDYLVRWPRDSWERELGQAHEEEDQQVCGGGGKLGKRVRRKTCRWGGRRGEGV